MLPASLKLSLYLTFCLFLILLPLPVQAQQTVSELAVSSYDRPDYAPKYSDVLTSSRWIRGVGYKTNVHFWGETYSMETLDILKMYHTTILSWIYTTDQNFAAQVHVMGIQIEPSMNNSGVTSEQALKYADGNDIVDKFGRAKGCANNDLFRNSFFNDRVKPMIDIDPLSLQIDDPRLNDGITCYCVYCNGTKNGTTATTEFYTWLHQQVDTYNGGKLAIHGNNTSQSRYSSSYFADIPNYRLDYGNSETDYKYISAQHFYNVSILARTYAGGNRAQVFNSPTKVEETDDNLWYRQITRRSIANCYAQGMHMIAPFDTYHAYPSNAGDESQATRYFGNPIYYSDLFAFIRGIAPYLDGYEFAWGWGRTPKATNHYQSDYGDTWGTPPGADQPIVNVADGRAVVIRAIPGVNDAPIAIHLVEWTGEGSFDITLNNERFFGDSNDTLKLTLLQPLDTYVQADHDAVWNTKAYENFVKQTILPKSYINGQTTVSVPGLSPWAVLLVSIDGNNGDLNNDYSVNLSDISEMNKAWQQNNSAVDQTGDDFVDANDLAVISNNWLNCFLPHATCLYPTNSQPKVPYGNITLDWAGADQCNFDVYFGTDANDVTQATRQSNAFLATTTQTQFDPCSLAINTEYYWRIDSVGPACTAKGATWNFTSSTATTAYWELDATDGSDAVGAYDLTVTQGNPTRVSFNLANINNPDDTLPWNSLDASAAANYASTYFDANVAMTCTVADDTFEFSNAKPFTCEGYVYPTGGTGTLHVIFGNRDSDSNWKGWYLRYDADNHRPMFYMIHPNTADTVLVSGSANSLPANTLKHVAVVWDPTIGATGQITVYVDGVIDIQVDGEAYWDATPAGQNFMVAGRNNSAPWGFMGQIEEVRWSHKPLTPADFLNATP